MAALSAPQAKPAALSRPQKPSKRARMPPAASVAAAPPALSAVVKGKRPRPSDGAGDGDKDRPRRSKSSRGQKRSDAPTASEGRAAGADAGGASALASQGEGGGTYRRAMFASFITQAFDKRAKGNNEEYNQIIGQFRALLPSASASQNASTSSAQPLTATPLAQLRTWLEALTSVVSKLDQSHAPLVETILAVPWAVTEEAFVAAYMRFVGALISARTEWLKPMLEKCVKGLKYRSPYTQASPHALPHLTRRLVYTRIHALLRLLLSLVPTLSPSLSPLLALHFPSKREPRAAQICYIDNLLLLTEYCTALSEDVLTLVVERALHIDVEIQGEPEDWEDVEEEMQAAAEASEGSEGKKRPQDSAVRDVVDRPMEDDPDDSDSDSDDDDDEEGGLDLDNLSSDDDEPDPVNDEDAARKATGAAQGMSEAAIRKVLDSRAKLDGILKVVLDHLAAAHADKRSLAHNNTSTVIPPGTPTTDVFDKAFATAATEPESTSREATPTADEPPPVDVVERRLTLFRTLLDIFDRTLLRTFKTRNVQFLLFYLCSLDVASSDHFIGVLLGRALFDLDAPSVTRVAAAGYVASFIARAQFVDAGMTRKVVRHLCSYLEGQMDDFARLTALATSIKGAGPAGGQDLPVFYAVAQAVFYIFCFRWKDLLEEEDDLDDEAALFGLDAGRKWMMGLETIKKAVSSSFNPLKVCAQPVVTQFASIAHKTSFMYCYGVLDANRRASSYRDSSSTGAANGSQPHMPAPPLRSVSTSSLLNTLTASQLHLSTPSPHGTPAPPAPAPAPSAAPRQLLVAEEMDSFFPFDPFKLPLSSVYIDSIYREWEGADDESTTSGDASSSTADSDDDDDTASSSAAGTEDDDDDEPAWLRSRGGLAVPGMNRGGADDEEDDEVARSFEAMSLSLSPQHESFGGRRALEIEKARSGNGTKARKAGKVVG
ncbi:RNA polymerase I-specific transcription initiation factor RRN3 family protein [Rhodotorula paludigena]|uniref:RNA polymerase I-specific transcription initiation factor RRN3 family protein n=1 Tax=Rhodotorula paludigena TaxID=86838 RepID=UPI00317712ED